MEQDTYTPDRAERARGHARTIAFGTAMLFFFGSCAKTLSRGPFETADFWLAVSLGGAAWGIAYLITYVAIVLAPGLFGGNPPQPPRERQDPPEQNGNHNDATVMQSQTAPAQARQEWGIKLNDGRLVPLRYGLEMKHITALAESVCIDGVKVLSERALDGAGIISRYAKEPPTGREFLAWLQGHQLIRPIGNNQYAVTDSLYDTLYDYSPSPADGYGN